MGYSTPNINVNPIIKIVNGPDNSVESSPPQNNMIPADFVQSYDNFPSQIVRNTISDNTIKIPVISTTGSSEENNSQNILNEGTPIIIKKLSG